MGTLPTISSRDLPEGNPPALISAPWQLSNVGGHALSSTAKELATSLVRPKLLAQARS